MESLIAGRSERSWTLSLLLLRSLPVADVNINLPAVDPLDLEESAQCMFNGEVFPW